MTLHSGKHKPRGYRDPADCVVIWHDGPLRGPAALRPEQPKTAPDLGQERYGAGDGNRTRVASLEGRAHPAFMCVYLHVNLRDHAASDRR